MLKMASIFLHAELGSLAQVSNNKTKLIFVSVKFINTLFHFTFNVSNGFWLTSDLEFLAKKSTHFNRKQIF